MKANRKFRGEDEAVSPVIAVILMVAITVVLAATVYVWVSGFGSQSSQPAKTLSLNSAGAITRADYDDGADTAADDAAKLYVVASATSGMRYSDITITVNGAPLTFASDANCTPDNEGNGDAGTWFACAGAAGTTTTRAGTDIVAAGDHITIVVAETALAGQVLRVLDPASNSVITTLTVA